MNTQHRKRMSSDCQPQESLESSASILGVPAAGALAAVVGTSCPDGGTRITSPYTVAHYGIDTLNLGFHIAIPHADRVFKGLSEQKSWLQSSDQQEAHYKFGHSDAFAFNLQRSGNRRFPYILKSGDITLLMSSRSHTHSAPNVVLEVGSISCQQGLDETIRQFKEWLHLLGCTIIQEKVSRIDIAADLKIAFADTGLDDPGRHISMSTNCTVYSSDRKLSGISVGRGYIVMRVYDKILEMKQKKAHIKETFFSILWGGKQKDITRVEFQLRRDIIKQMFPDDSRFETVNGRIAEIWSYLTVQWFRQTDGPVDRKNKHQSRCKVSAFWEQVQAASGFKSIPIKRNRSQVHINIPALKKMVSGCLLSIIAGLGHKADDFFGIMGTAGILSRTNFGKCLKRLPSKRSLPYVKHPHTFHSEVCHG